ncbi:hypothetical protein HPB51_004905 [Rhipicephalus microplus]|uniref:Uncharacterized protein n=1 Tax=Rhipicephalus microplus TaxID=6941 RepID=A0A9J6E6E1_RHIMP|nr:hypothetical protein HPB51_004905 [Rhipicephalus microplus]
MHLGVIEMASLDALPSTNPSSAATASSSWASRKAAAVFKAAATARSAAAAAAANRSSTGSGDVSAKTIISVFVVLGVFLVVSVVGAAVTFVETQAKDARNHNHSSPCVEYIQFAPNETLPQGSEQPPESLPSSLASLEEQTPSQTPPSASEDVKAPPTSQDRGVYAGEASNNGTFSFGRILDAMAAGKGIKTGADHP